MIHSERGYIARKYWAHEYGAKSIYEESIFDSYNSAFAYVLSISEEDHDRFLCEIVSLIIGDAESWESEEVWTFDRKGKLIRHYEAQKRYDNDKIIEHSEYKSVEKEPRPNSFTGKFDVGDIVIVRAYPWNNESPIPENTIGVISHRPNFYQDWIKAGNDKFNWDCLYVIDFIRDGYICHMHISETHLKMSDGGIPDNLSFLHRLSLHFKGHNIIDKKLFDQIYDGDVFIENVRFYKDIINQKT